ncbi:MAG TPA: DUF1761 domain-containing protein [Candidatus Saccharimonadales bacterium]|nr:DUF1761 domain-containing protein [Candidatus Saccharimonadales bacterium]
MESFTYHLEQVNWVAIAVATLTFYFIGGLWYSQAGFGKQWMKAVGLTKKDAAKAKMEIVMPLSGLLGLASAVGLSVLMCALELSTWQQGVGLGVLVALGFVVASQGVHRLFEGKSLKLFLIDAGFSLLFFGAAGGIIGAF